MRIQYASDIHLEFHTSYEDILIPSAPVLVLAGDIGWPGTALYADFLQWCSSHWDVVFLVAGNHEFYNQHDCKVWKYNRPDTVEERITAIEDIALTMSNVHFLNRNRVMYKGVAFLGCTLWSDLSETRAAAIAGVSMNDYRRIALADEICITPEDVTSWWKQDREWLKEELARCSTEGHSAVVVTHHLPTYDLISPQYEGSPLNPAFASACDDLICSPVRTWIAGHTHSAVVLRRGDTYLGVNPVGYPGEQKYNGFCRNIVVDTGINREYAD